MTVLLPYADALLELAVELEAVADGGVPDISTDDQLLHAVSGKPMGAVLAGIVLAHLMRVEPDRVGRFLEALPASTLADFVAQAMSVQGQAAARVLGAARLRDALLVSRGLEFHDHVAAALSLSIIPDSDICLTVMLPRARRQLGSALAERAGRSEGTMPEWPDSDSALARDVLPAFCFGLLSGRFAARFPHIAMSLDHAAWRDLQKLVQSRQVELTPSGIGLFVAARDAAGAFAAERPMKLSRAPAGRAPETTRAADGRALCKRAEAASAEEIPALLPAAAALTSATWRREAQVTLLRRAIETGAGVSPFGFGLSRTDLAAELAAARVLNGDLRRLGGKSWSRIELDRRFRILSRLLTEPGRDEQETSCLSQAIAAMPGAVRGILVERFVTMHGHTGRADGEVEQLLRGAALDGEGMAFLARTHALRADATRASEAARAAGLQSDQRASHDAVQRLKQLLQRPADVPGPLVPAVTSALAMMDGDDLSNAVALCRSSLRVREYECVVADLIVRGRALEAFGELL